MENAEGPNYGEESALREASDGEKRLFGLEKTKGTSPPPLFGRGNQIGSPDRIKRRAISAALWMLSLR